MKHSQLAEEIFRHLTDGRDSDPDSCLVRIDATLEPVRELFKESAGFMVKLGTFPPAQLSLIACDAERLSALKASLTIPKEEAEDG